MVKKDCPNNKRLGDVKVERKHMITSLELFYRIYPSCMSVSQPMNALHVGAVVESSGRGVTVGEVEILFLSAGHETSGSEPAVIERPTSQRHS